MLDVHPPHTPTHSWRDFFIHVGTICVGLLIAVGLEQTVEAVHRQRERNELRESLRRESDQVARDCERLEPAMTGEIDWHEEMANLLLKSAREHQPIGRVPPYARSDFDVPGDPVYLAAKASTKLELLTQPEIQAYGELDAVIGDVRAAYQLRIEALDSDQKAFSALPLGNPSIAVTQNATFQNPRDLEKITLTPASLDELYKGTISAEISTSAFRYRSRQVRGAAVELQKGDRDLQKIQAAERQFDKLP